MPPSPSMRFSPGRDIKQENHKRGRSLENGRLFRDKDDDLALFNEMHTREREDFLLQSNDDFEDVFSTKLRYFSDHKLGISVPVRGESSDLLNADGEKNDYDWLLTPPDTPLFRSLDDETPPVNLVQRGRPRSQPISISRSSTMEKSYRSSRGSASPNRLSPSPRSGSSTFQSRGRPSSAPHSSPTPTLRNGTPSKRPSSPSSKPSTPVPRSSTPTPRRISTGSSGTLLSSRVRGTSPVPSSRGNSASPKVKAWQSNIPGFPSDAPPNLRTSLADRPASYVRGSSPASRNGRHSMSPTASRSASSSYSHDRDRFSSHSKGSVASSGDDDIDSVQSISLGSSERTMSRRVGAFPNNNRASAFQKKPSRTVSSSSAPKRSFDSALRQMDNRKGPQNMFRPLLLSSVPSSTFYVGKASAAHRAMISRNSSVTTSSNASSDQGTGGVLVSEGSDQNRDDMASDPGKAPYPDAQDEVFVLDKADAVTDSNGHGTHSGSPNIRHGDFNSGSTDDTQLAGSEFFSRHDTDMTITSISEANGLEDNILCSKCGRICRAIESTDGNSKLCPDCRREDEHSAGLSMEIPEEYKPFDSAGPLMTVPESSEVTDIGERRTIHHEESVKACESSQSEPVNNLSSESSLARSPLEDGNPRLASDLPNLKADVSDGAGISILLKRSSSGMGPVVRGRTFSASSIPYDDLSYVIRDSTSSLRTASASSSVDLGSARHTDTRVQRQLSGKKSDMENNRYDMHIKHQRTGSSLSGTSGHAFQTSGLATTSSHEEHSEISISRMENDAINFYVACQEQLLASENTQVDDTSSEVQSNSDSQIVVSACEVSNHRLNHQLVGEDSASNGNSDDLPKNARSTSDLDVSAMSTETGIVEESTISYSGVDDMDVAEVPNQILLDTISEIEIENDHPGSPGSQSRIVSLPSKGAVDEFQDPFVANSTDKDIAASVTQCDTSDNAHGILEESTTKTRSLTLDEATDTILFCSSIVHNLAYEAATIAIDKENLVPFEGSRPTVTILGKSTPDRKDSRSKPAAKRTSKSQKARQRRVETETKTFSGNSESDEKTDSSTTRIVGVPNKFDSTKPPKLESKCNCTVM